MMTPEEMEQLIRETRDQLGFTRGVPPEVEEVDRLDNGTLLVVTADRAEKSVCLGPGGRIVAKISKRLGQPVTIVAREELLARRQRLRTTAQRINELAGVVTPPQQDFLGTLRQLIQREMIDALDTIREGLAPSRHVKVTLAFSGGTDSCAAAILLSRAEIRPTLATVDLGRDFLSEHDMRAIREIADQLDLPHEVVPGGEMHAEVARRAIEEAVHPCGKCHALMYDLLIEHAREQRGHVLVTGELLPTGRQSIVSLGRILMVHLPAALAMTKYRDTLLCREAEVSPLSGGCRLIRRALGAEWRITGPAVFRVLRELEAGVLTTGEALDQVKSLFKVAMRNNSSGTGSTITEEEDG